MQSAVPISVFCRRRGARFSSDTRYGKYRCFPGLLPAHWRRVAVAFPSRQFPIISRRFGVPFPQFWRVFFETIPKTASKTALSVSHAAWL
jgi:hypothetical protein